MFHRCPRCGGDSLESFNTHIYCASCNYDGEQKNESSTNSDEWLKLLSELELLVNENPPKRTNMKKVNEDVGAA